MVSASPADPAPYLYSVPSDLVCFAALLRALGVRDSFSAEDFCLVLKRMAASTGVLIGEYVDTV